MSRWSSVTVAALALTGTISFALPKTPHGLHHGSDELNPQRPECPHSYDKIKAPDSTALDTGVSVVPPPEMGRGTFSPTMNIPEFNDCQQIVLETGNQYGPLMSVFASDRLEHLGESHNVARGTGASAGDAIRAVAAVLVFNYSRGYSYAPLGIGPYFNCLYLWGSPSHWQARMIKRGTNNACDPTVAISTIGESGTQLAVIEAPRGVFTKSEDYPAAARWEWDRVNRLQYIGLRCGLAWCQVGRADAAGNPTFKPAPPYLAPPTDVRRDADRVRAVKGWYDEQLLEYVEDVGGRKVARVSTLIGRVFPAPRLALRTEHSDFSTFVPVAFVALEKTAGDDPAVAYYKGKFNYEVIPIGRGLGAMTELAMCYGSATHCAPECVISGSCLRPHSRTVLLESCGGEGRFRGLVNAGTESWWARLTSPRDSSRIFRCVTQRTHDPAPPPNMPATARWRWLASDETTWNYCMSGCCETEGDQPSGT